MTTDLDARGRAAAAGLRDLIAGAVGADAVDDAYETSIGRRHRAVPTQERLMPRRRWQVVAILVAAAAAVVTVLVIKREDRDEVPSVPPPGPVVTTTLSATTTTAAPTTTPPPTTPPTTAPATSSTVAEATTALATIGPDSADLLPYPPDAVALTDGRVLKIVVGIGEGTVSRLEVLDPVFGQVTVVGQLLVNRANPAMVVLQDGRVLIAGGDVAGNTIAAVSTGEVFDPTTGKSTSAGPMVAARWSPRAGLLPDGRVLVVGSLPNPPNTPATAVAEVYDTTTNSFSATGSRSSTDQVTAVLSLSDGRLLVMGSRPELYDPVTGTFAVAAGRTNSTLAASVLLSDGTVLAIDGNCSETHTLDADGVSEGHASVATERFHPATGTFTPGPSLPHCVETATRLPSGEIFVTGYWWKAAKSRLDGDNQVAWSGVLDPVSGTTRITPNPNRRSPRAVILPDGRVVLVAGVPLGNEPALPWADIYRAEGTG